MRCSPVASSINSLDFAAMRRKRHLSSLPASQLANKNVTSRVATIQGHEGSKRNNDVDAGSKVAAAAAAAACVMTAACAAATSTSLCVCYVVCSLPPTTLTLNTCTPLSRCVPLCDALLVADCTAKPKAVAQKSQTWHMRTHTYTCGHATAHEFCTHTCLMHNTLLHSTALTPTHSPQYCSHLYASCTHMEADLVLDKEY